MNTSVQLITPTVNSNLLSLTDGHTEPTMSSIEISELVQSRHDNVKRTMERLVDRELISITPMEEPPSNGGKPLTVYHVNERNSYVVVAQLSPEFSAVLVDEWRRLKNLVSLPDFNDPALAARAWADEVEQKQLLEAKIKEDAPMLAYAETITESDGSLNLRDTAKSFGLGPIKFNKFLKGTGRLYRSGKQNLPVQIYVDSGVFEVKTVRKGEQGITTQTFVTSKGQEFLHALVVKHQHRGTYPELIGVNKSNLLEN